MENSAASAILDLAVGIRRLSGDRDLYIQIMEIFFSQAEGQLQTIRQALDARNAEVVRRISHGMKGAAANLGALRVQETARQLEALGADEDMENASPLVERLKRDVAELSDFWQAERAKTIE
jgi:HPt (histidine-containing phosphotransfer) domain-containing protein